MQEQKVHAINVHNDGVSRNVRRVAVNEQEFVEYDGDYLRAEQDAERGYADAGYSAHFAQGKAEHSPAEFLYFPDEIGGAGKHGDDLSQSRRYRRAENAVAEALDKEPVQHDIGDEARRHSAHCTERRAEIPKERHTARREYLHRGETGEHEDIGVGIIVDRAFRSEGVYEIRINADQQRRDDRARKQEIKERVAQPPLFRFGVTSAPRHREHNGTAHSHARPDRVYERDERIGDVYGGKSVVADVVAHEKTVHDGIQPRERKSHHRRKNETQKSFQHIRTSKRNCTKYSGKRGCVQG